MRNRTRQERILGDSLLRVARSGVACSTICKVLESVRVEHGSNWTSPVLRPTPEIGQVAISQAPILLAEFTRMHLTDSNPTDLLSCFRTSRLLPWLAFVTLSVVSFVPLSLWGQTDQRIVPHPPKPAPDIHGGVEWINTKRPIQLADLRGKFVILDFWTYCCINCLQTLPDLKQLERAYPDELVVIGVHAPKFFGERDTANIREAVRRHEIEHPVVNDAQLAIAKRYGVQGWPTLAFIDPEGNQVAMTFGEATFESLNAFLRRQVARHRRRINKSPLDFISTTPDEEPTPLRFPSKVLADVESKRIFIADSGHHRIVVATWDGQVRNIVGTGERGSKNGDFSTATFSMPQGLALDGTSLLVADTENHMIRKIDFTNNKVTTLAGTGRQGTALIVRNSRRPTSQAIASPWDLAIHDQLLYIAMAGTHQIWRMTLNGDRIQTYAGSGTEDIVDGSLRLKKTFDSSVANFAQPTGLAAGPNKLYIADSEGSSIRAIDYDSSGSATTVLGTPNLPQQRRLFTYGDVDGPTNRALLQHPMCVAVDGDQLFVADTYNNKIKLISLSQGTIKTFAGAQGSGDSDDPPRFDEPAGLCFADGTLFVADTNNHVIRKLDVATGTATTLQLNGLTPPSARGEADSNNENHSQPSSSTRGRR